MSSGSLLGGSCVAYRWAYISPLMWIMIKITLPITPLITTHETPSRAARLKV